MFPFAFCLLRPLLSRNTLSTSQTATFQSSYTSRKITRAGFTARTTMAPKLEQVFTLRAFLGKDNILNFGSVKGGPHRIIVPVVGGFMSGSGIEATILPGGADWLLLDPITGTAHLDIRFQARSSSGDMIYGHCPGIIRMDEEIQKFLEWDPEAMSRSESRIP